MKILERLQYIALFIVSFAIIGVGEVITGDIGWETITDASFYISQLTKDAAILCVTFGTVYAYIDWFKNKDETYKLAEKDVREFATSPNNVPSILSSFLDRLNRKRKIKQYQSDIRYELYKLDQYIPWYMRVLPVNWRKCYSDDDKRIWVDGTDEDKKNNKYCIKRKMLEDKLKQENIEKYIDFTHVKFQKVTESVILGGYYKEGTHKNVNDGLSGPIEKAVVFKKIPALLFSFAGLFVISSVIFGDAVFNWDAAIDIGVASIALLWNVITAMRLAKRICEENVRKDMLFRSSIIKEYELWCKQESDKRKSGGQPNESGTTGKHNPVNGTNAEVRSSGVQAEIVHKEY